jgi:hypothetical protein
VMRHVREIGCRHTCAQAPGELHADHVGDGDAWRRPAGCPLRCRPRPK